MNNKFTYGIPVTDEKEMIEVQKTLFEHGYRWMCGGRNIMKFSDIAYIFFHSTTKNITFGKESASVLFLESPDKYRKISFSEYRRYLREGGEKYYVNTDPCVPRKIKSRHTSLCEVVRAYLR